MNYFDNEEKLIDYFQSLFKTQETALLPNYSNKLNEIVCSIALEENWSGWKNNSSKDAPPPDFYSDDFSLMMEVMRVDDCAFESGEGKIINKVNANESKAQKKLEPILDKLPHVHAAHVISAVDMNIPTDEHHNYSRYYKNFVRVVEKHKNQVSLYRKNHPNKKLIFFIMDESTAYIETSKISDKSKIGFAISPNQIHLPCRDKKFMQVFEDSDIDYFIWYMPYKHFTPVQSLNDIDPNNLIPKTVVIDIKKISEDEWINYKDELMMSSEI